MANAPLPPELRTYLAVGFERLAEHQLTLAGMLFERVLAGAPDHAEALRGLGITLFRKGRGEEAVARLRRAAELGGAEASGDLAVALQRLGQGEAAAQAWRSAGRAGPLPPDAAFSVERAEQGFKLFDYGYTAKIRWGEGRPSHPQLAETIGAGRARYRALLDGLGEIHPDLETIPLGGDNRLARPFWLNAWFASLDAMALMHMLRAGNPALFLEIGSGFSTMFAREAVRRYGLRTRLVSIDPQPRAEIDALCDETVRRPLEDCDLSIFDRLEAGDILFLDSSHRCFQGSDVTVFFLEILPRLKSGVIVHIHDVYLPDDYVSGHVRRIWNEQYLLGVLLLFGQGFEILFPSWFVTQDPELSQLAAERICKGALKDVSLFGASFWMRKA
ncbi:class I SAM-dependent methyltransferase [Phenylobacterium terrae]|uniref:Class I SAM-dependent methyltransferase n=1 Tax=Phenylobacterium terrae TaxID=2665495 RepID=A0ABW4N1N8_9CAUL